MNSTRNTRVNEQSVPYVGVEHDQFTSSIREGIEWIRRSTESIEMNNLAKEVSHCCEVFASKFFGIREKLAGIHLKSFVEGCKNRSEELTQLMNCLSLVDNEVDIVILNKKTEYCPQKITYISGRDNHIYLVGSDDDDVAEVYVIHREPKCYSPLFVGMLKVMDAALKLQFISRTEYKFCMYLAEILISTSRIYLEFRSNQAMIDEQEQEILAELQSGHMLDVSSDFYDTLFEVQCDIQDDKKAYVREFCQALRQSRDFIESPFSDDDYYYSAKASSSTIKYSEPNMRGRKKVSRRKECSILSSAWEIDSWSDHPVNEVIGYKSSYNKVALDGYDDPIVVTSSINQHKIKRRIIHVGNNPTQDRCSYIHRRMIRFLAQIPSDCTLYQDGGVTFARRVTSQKYREKNGYPTVLCLDFTNATDTLNQEFQCHCLGLLFKPEVVDFWKDLSSLQKRFRFAGKSPDKEYVQSTGQPQGLLGSFDSFALAHHIIMLMVMRHCELEEVEASHFYRILGDDSIICTTVPDPADIVLETYKGICEWANLTINLDKSRITRHVDSVAFAEFAKVSVLNGEIMTPPPIRILSRIGLVGTNYYSYTTAIWMFRHGYAIAYVFDYLNERFYGIGNQERFLADCLMFEGIIPQFKDLRRISTISKLTKARITVSYLVTKVQGTFVECLMKDREREEFLLNRYKLQDHLKALIDHDTDYFVSILESSDHKLVKALTKNRNIHTALRSILDVDNIKLYCAIIDLTIEECRAIQSLADILELINDGLFDEALIPTVGRISKGLETLDRFQMRSVHKAIACEISYLDNAIRLSLQLFPDVYIKELTMAQDLLDLEQD